MRSVSKRFGTIVIGGGGTYSEDLWKTLAQDDREGRTVPRKLLIDTSATIDDVLAYDKARYVEKKIIRAGGTAATLPRPLPSAACAAEILARFDGIWFTGGLIGAISHRYRNTAMETQLRNLLSEGGLVGGTSAGAVALCQKTWNQRSKTRTGTGLSLIPALLLGVHANSARRKILQHMPVPMGTMKLMLAEGKYVVLPIAEGVRSTSNEAWDTETQQEITALQPGVRRDLQKKHESTSNCD